MKKAERNAGKFPSARLALQVGVFAGEGMFDSAVSAQIAEIGDARKVEREAREWADMFENDSPLRSDLIDIAIIAERMA